MRAIAEKQRGFKGIGEASTTQVKGSSQKDATTGLQPVFSTKGLMVGKTWRVKADPMNIIIERRQVSKKSCKERWELEGYFGTLAGALQCLVEKSLRETELRDLQTVVDRIEELKRDISLALKGIEIEC